MTSDEELSRRYQALQQEEPSPQLDAKILAAAAQPRTRPARWPRFVAAAAVVVLSIGVVTRMNLDPDLEDAFSSAPTASPPAASKAEPGAAPEAGPPPASMDSFGSLDRELAEEELRDLASANAAQEALGESSQTATQPAKRAEEASPQLSRARQSQSLSVESPAPLEEDVAAAGTGANDSLCPAEARRGAEAWCACIKRLREAKDPGAEAEIEAYRGVFGDELTCAY